MSLIIQNLSKHYGSVPVFRNVSLDVKPGEFVAIVGESGVGKSTLLNCMAGLDSWDSGSVLLDGLDLSTQSDDQLARLRREKTGFVFQAFHVLPHLSVSQNVALPLMLLGQLDDARVQAMLTEVGLDGLGERLPQQLSGGQLQRVAIARALIHRPMLLLADEPTGNLDPDTSADIMLLLERINRTGTTVVMATHDNAIVDSMRRRVIELQLGKVVRDEARGVYGVGR